MTTRDGQQSSVALVQRTTIPILTAPVAPLK